MIAAAHDGDLVRHRHRLELVVGDVDRGRADAIVQLTELAHHEVAELRVERAERLVHEEGHRPADDGAAERDALAVAAGEAGDGLVEQIVDPKEARRLLDALANLGLAHALALEREADVLAHVHVRVEGEELEDEGDVAGGGAVEGDVLAAEQDAARGRQLEPGDHAERRRLAAAGRTEQHQELAVGDGEIRIRARQRIRRRPCADSRP